MMDVSLKGFDITKVVGYLEAQRKDQLPYAVSNGLNDLAFQVRAEEIRLIQTVFKNPKPQTQKNVFVKKATKEKWLAIVVFDQIYDKGVDEYMVVNIEGGPRLMKPSERRLNRFYVPGDGAKLDRYGNMQGGQVTQILSRLGRFGDVAGYNMNETLASKLKRQGAKKTLEYVMISKPHGGLMPGIYQRTQRTGTGFGGKTTKLLPVGAFQKGRGNGKVNSVIQMRGLLPIMIFVKSAPTYKAVWPYFDRGQEIVENGMGEAMEKAFDYAIKTAR